MPLHSDTGHIHDILVCGHPARGGCLLSFVGHLFQGLPVTMATQKPFRLVLCTWPASIPSGVGTCHHRNRFPSLTRGLSDGQQVGVKWQRVPSWEQDVPWPGWQ